MKTRIRMLVLIAVLALSITTVQGQDNSNTTNPFLRGTIQTDNHLNATFTKQGEFQRPNSLHDPGPVWQGLTDTTAFHRRMEQHLYRAETQIDWIKKQLTGYTKDHKVGFSLYEPATDKALRYLSADRELENARLLARAALNAHPEKTFRDVAQRWESKLSEKIGQLNTDFEVYFYLTEIDSSKLTPELRYITNQKLADFERNGVMLNKKKRQQVAKLKSEITILGNRFERNIFTADTTITIPIDSLSGTPSEWLKQQKSDERGLVSLPINNPTMNLIMVNADNQNTRRIAARAFFNRSYPQNLSILDSLRTARHDLAQLLGYESWAHYALEPTMAGSPERVQNFLSNTDRTLNKHISRKIDQLRQLKKELNPTAKHVEWVDWRYLLNKMNEQDNNFNALEMREYLPYEQVRDGLFSTVEKLFELDIRAAPNLPVWSSDAKPYEVWENKKLIGRIYLDVYPRKGKFSHAGAFPLRMGNNTVPETTLLVNLPGTPQEPGLLSPSQLTTFFHEFGHALHILFQGNNSIVGTVEQDFIEAPSQLFEEWSRDPEVLHSFAKHYKTGKAIPQKLIKAYKRSDEFGRALRAHYNLWPAHLSLELYNSAPEYKPIETVEESVFNTSFRFERPDWFTISSALPHLYPYSSNFYTYSWSDVVGKDLLTGFNNSDLMDPNSAKGYRKIILERSGTAPMEELIEEFLGRPFNSNAWQAWLNGGNDQTSTQQGR